MSFYIIGYVYVVVVSYLIWLLWLMQYNTGEYGAHTQGRQKHLNFIQPKRSKNMQFGAAADIYMVKHYPF